MSNEHEQSVVVGVDGSPSALDAVRWAVTEAGLRGLPVTLAAVLEAQVVPTRGVTARTVQEIQEARRSRAEADLERAAAIARDLDPSVSVHRTVREGSPAAQLLENEGSTAMVVLGTRGLGGFTGLLAGSVTMAVMQRATLPVVVVRGTARPGGPVVVGVDGSAASEVALGFAAQEAVRRRAELHVLHAWNEIVLHPETALNVDWDARQDAEQQALDEAVAPCRERYPELVIRARAIRDGAGRGLVAESAHAQLVVVGSRGRGAVVAGLLGSVSRSMVHHAGCPVAVVHAPAN